MVYVGQTKNKLKDRLKKHDSDVKNKFPRTALVEHVCDTGHTFNFKDTMILENETKLRERLFLEMFHINKSKNSVNFRRDVENLSTIYNNLINCV